MLAMRLRTGLLGLVTMATITATPVMAQTPCYLPDGTMIIGSFHPANCSLTRPKGRDEAIQRDANVYRPPSREAAERAAFNETLMQLEVNRRLSKDRRMKVDRDQVERDLKSCDSNRQSQMTGELAALCSRHWNEKAARTLSPE